MNIRTVGRVAVLVLVTTTQGCHRQLSSSASSPEYTVEQVLGDPQAFTHRVLTIRGCITTSSGPVALHQCQKSDSPQLIWLEDAAFIGRLLQSRLPEVPASEPSELRSSQPFLLFEYDETRNSKAWETVGPAWPEKVLEVKLTGQFEITSPGLRGLSGRGPILGEYPYELIVENASESRVFQSGSVPSQDWNANSATGPDGLQAPVHKQIVDVGPSLNNPVGERNLRVRITCFYYPDFMVKEEYEDMNKGTNSASIVPVTHGIPECSRAHISGERVLTEADMSVSGGNPNDWGGEFFSGAKDDLLFFEEVDGLHGGRLFTIYSLKNGKALFEDSAVTSGEWGSQKKHSGIEKRQLIAGPSGTVTLQYWRVMPTDCDLYKREPCWQDVRTKLGLKTSKVPNCQYWEAVRSKRHYASAIVYPVEVSLIPQPQIKAVDGPVTCWPVS